MSASTDVCTSTIVRYHRASALSHPDAAERAPASDETEPISLGSTEWEQIGSNSLR
jgi:hypothetical protein